MKVRIIQPEYSKDHARLDELFEAQKRMIEACDDSLDMIVLPESSDVPAYAATKEQFEAAVEKYNSQLLELASATAKRCDAVLFINAVHKVDTGWRNTTFAFDRKGALAGTYDKQHLTRGEVEKRKLDSRYTFEPEEVTVVSIDGIRYAFLTCYDFYFYESYSAIARKNVDVVIGCSHQRSDTHSALEIFGRFLAYNTNAYVVRASVSMGEDSPVGGGSMVVAPNGDMLVNMCSRVGWEDVEIDVSKKYYKPAGFGNPPSAHWQYVEDGRRPWKYRPAGPAMVATDEWMGYPRVCAHRGFNTIAPENSMPAFGAAVAMGAEEIEFDLWPTLDGEIVSIHDPTLDRVSDGSGKVYEHTYAQLLKYDFGAKHGAEFAGMRIVTFEEILKKFAGQVIMNVHIKTGNNNIEYDPAVLKKIIDLIDKYDCRRHVYFMTGNHNLLRLCREMAPDICRCAGAGDDPWKIVDLALEYGCRKVQLFKPYFDQSMIDRAHENGIICNVFWSDDPDETRRFRDMGIDVILTNDYNRIANVVKAH